MIIEREFPDHWKTRYLMGLLKDERAPVYLIRLWAHCEASCRDRWPVNATMLASVCRYPGQDPEEFLKALVDSGWIELDGNTMIVHGWAELNAKYLAAKLNGRLYGPLGGRPKKSKGLSQQEPNPPQRVIPTETRTLSDAPQGLRFPKHREGRVGELRKDSPLTPLIGREGIPLKVEENLKDALGCLISTKKIPELKYEHLVLLWREHPKAEIEKNWDQLVIDCKGVVGVVGDTMAWLRKKAAAMEERESKRLMTPAETPIFHSEARQ